MLSAIAMKDGVCNCSLIQVNELTCLHVLLNCGNVKTLVVLFLY